MILALKIHYFDVKWVNFVLNKLGKAGEEILMLINKASRVLIAKRRK